MVIGLLVALDVSFGLALKIAVLARELVKVIKKPVPNVKE